MQTYVSILRGINVSGQKKIKMVDLRAMYESLGFSNIVSYIQSGNVAFQSPLQDQRSLAQQIEAAILDHFTFEVPVIVLNQTELENTLTNNPFSEEKQSRSYVTFLAEEPEYGRVEKVKALDYAPEEWVLAGKIIYFYSPSGYGRAKMSNNFFEQKLKVRATTRNWKTVHKLLQMTQ